MKRQLKIRNTNLSFLVFVFMLLFSFKGFTQSRRINGKVVDASSIQPIPGVNVKVKGGATTTITDVNGDFFIEAKASDVLVFTFVSYQQKEVTIGDKNTIDVKLSSSTSNLNEVVVIGYGTSKRKDLTGSIASISAKDLAVAQATTFDQALQGRVAGVMVQTTSGQPGGAISVQIRGLGTLLANKDPLYVIDGVIIPPARSSSTGGVYLGNAQINDNPLASINPADIASIDVLKDASAIAIYGSQGSAGVVVVTTKRGKTGAPQIIFDGYYGVQKLYKKISMLNLQEYARFLNTKALIQGGVPQPQYVNPDYLGAGTDWQDEIFKSAATYTGNLSVSGGDTRTQYFISGNHFYQDGQIIGSSLKRESFKLTLDNKTTNWLKIGSSLNISGIKENVNSSQYDIINTTLGLTPDIATKNPDGSISFPPGFVGTYNPNPIAASALNTNQIQRTQIFGNVYAELNFTKDLVLKNELTEWFDFGNVNQFNPSLTINTSKTQSSAYVQSSDNKTYTIRNYLTYNHSLKNGLNINVLAAHEASSGLYTYLSGGRTGFVANDPNGLSLGDAKTATNSGGTSDYSNEAYFGRVNLNYNDKYYLTMSIRDDGNSNFAPGNRWVKTYGFAGSWDAAREAFLKDNKVIDQLKIRASYGLTNNANIGGYKYGASISLVTVGLGAGSKVNNIAIRNIKWETTKGYDLGLDLGFLKNRIQLTTDIYYRKTGNLLLQAPLPIYSGDTGTGQLSAPIVNIGSIENKGFEITLNTHNIQGRDFNWNTTLTATIGKTKVLSLINDNAFLTGIIDNGQISVTRTAVNGGIGDFYGYIADGLYKNGADLANSPRQAGLSVDQRNGVWIGDVKYRDISGPDGKPDGIIDQYDQTYLGSPIPKMQFGINNTLTYKDFSLTIFFNGNYGNKILNYETSKHGDPNGGGNYFSSVLNYARIGLLDPNGVATDPNNLYVTNNTNVPAIRIAGNPNTAVSSRFIENGSFLRLKNLNIGYNIPKNLTSKWKINSLRVYVSATNLFTITKYTGYDPEIGSALGSSGGTNSLTTGIDYGHYPSPRFYTFGFNAAL